MLFKDNKMGCPSPGVPSECSVLAQYYNTPHQTRCQFPGRLRCPGGSYRYHTRKGSCSGIKKHSCCAPDLPNHSVVADFQCCTGTVPQDKGGGYCEVNTCPYSGYCNEYMASTCSIPGNTGSWTSKGNNCTDYVIGSTTSGMPGAEAGGANVVLQTMKRYFATPYKPEDLTDTSFPVRVKIAKSICSVYPEKCEEALTNWCSTVTREDVIKSPELLTLCGCYMPGKQYPYDGFVDTDCSTTCNRQETIQPSNWKCNQTVCIIDNVDINMVDSDGNVNLNQLCGQAGNSVCLLKDINVNAVNSKVGSGGVTVDQQCTRCYKWQGDPTGRIPDEVLLGQPGSQGPEGWIPPAGWVPTPCEGEGGGPSSERRWVIVGLGVLVLVALLLIALLILVV